ncbi:MAG: DUF485 domain-containing protein [Streptomycetaceae bacterium]|nr:DUF485 domain-containing protein [Streptomycetaceae bacterium]
MARRRNTVRLGAAGALLALYLGFVLLTTSTSVLSGRVAGLGTAYWAAFAIFAAVIVLAQVYTAWAKRLDDVIAPYREAGAGRAEGGAR